MKVYWNFLSEFILYNLSKKYQKKKNKSCHLKKFINLAKCSAMCHLVTLLPSWIHQSSISPYAISPHTSLMMHRMLPTIAALTIQLRIHLLGYVPFVEPNLAHQTYLVVHWVAILSSTWHHALGFDSCNFTRSLCPFGNAPKCICNASFIHFLCIFVYFALFLHQFSLFTPW